MENHSTIDDLRIKVRTWIENQLICFLFNKKVTGKGCSIGQFLLTPRSIDNVMNYFGFHPIAIKRFFNCWIGLNLLRKQQNVYQLDQQDLQPDEQVNERMVAKLKSIVPCNDSHIEDYIKYFFEILHPFFQSEIFLAAIKTNKSQWFRAKGLKINQVFELCPHDPELPQLYARLFHHRNMDGDNAAFQYLNIIDGVKILDFGSGIGQQSVRLLSNYPNIDHITLYEYEKAEQIYSPYLNSMQKKYPKKLSVVFGDFFRSPQDNTFKGLYKLSPGRKFDYIFLSWILHDWDDEKCEIILNKARSHIKPTGKLILFESVLDEDGLGVIPTYDILMLITANGMERKLSQYKNLLKKAGFKLDECIRYKKGRDLMIASMEPEK